MSSGERRELQGSRYTAGAVSESQLLLLGQLAPQHLGENKPCLLKPSAWLLLGSTGQWSAWHFHGAQAHRQHGSSQGAELSYQYGSSHGERVNLPVALLGSVIFSNRLYHLISLSCHCIHNLLLPHLEFISWSLQIRPPFRKPSILGTWNFHH